MGGVCQTSRLNENIPSRNHAWHLSQQDEASLWSMAAMLWGIQGICAWCTVLRASRWGGKWVVGEESWAQMAVILLWPSGRGSGRQFEEQIGVPGSLVCGSHLGSVSYSQLAKACPAFTFQFCEPEEGTGSLVAYAFLVWCSPSNINQIKKNSWLLLHFKDSPKPWRTGLGVGGVRFGWEESVEMIQKAPADRAGVAWPSSGPCRQPPTGCYFGCWKACPPQNISLLSCQVL